MFPIVQLDRIFGSVFQIRICGQTFRGSYCKCLEWYREHAGLYLHPLEQWLAVIYLDQALDADELEDPLSAPISRYHDWNMGKRAWSEGLPQLDRARLRNGEPNPYQS